MSSVNCYPTEVVLFATFPGGFKASRDDKHAFQMSLGAFHDKGTHDNTNRSASVLLGFGIRSFQSRRGTNRAQYESLARTSDAAPVVFRSFPDPIHGHSQSARVVRASAEPRCENPVLNNVRSIGSWSVQTENP